jgi:L-ascorbate metabolism protein UlaG (beta-lactamase superfamily)
MQKETIQNRFFVETPDSWEFYFQIIGGHYDHCEEYVKADDLKKAYEIFIERYGEVNMLSITRINENRTRQQVWTQGEKVNYK